MEHLRQQFEKWQQSIGLDAARLARDGRYPDYYGNPVVQAAWEGFRAGAQRADDLMLNAVDNLNDMPISYEWSNDWCRRALALLPPMPPNP